MQAEAANGKDADLKAFAVRNRAGSSNAPGCYC